MLTTTTECAPRKAFRTRQAMIYFNAVARTLRLISQRICGADQDYLGGYDLQSAPRLRGHFGSRRPGLHRLRQSSDANAHCVNITETMNEHFLWVRAYYWRNYVYCTRKRTELLNVRFFFASLSIFNATVSIWLLHVPDHHLDKGLSQNQNKVITHFASLGMFCTIQQHNVQTVAQLHCRAIL